VTYHDLKSSPDIQVIGITVDQHRVATGEPVHVNVTLVNYGDSEGSFNLSVLVSGVEEVVKVVSLYPGETLSEVFQVVRFNQGLYEIHCINISEYFETIHSEFHISGLSVSPNIIQIREKTTIYVNVSNPNPAKLSKTIQIYVEPTYISIPVELGGYQSKTVTHNVSRDYAHVFSVLAGNHSQWFQIENSNPEPLPDEEDSGPLPEPYMGDPATDNITSLLPPDASPLRLSLPASIDDIFCNLEAGTGGSGLHAGGHKEGLDHVWIEIKEGIPVRSWADGTVKSIDFVGDPDHGEYFIEIDYGYNLTGEHMEVSETLVEVGDSVERGQPVGYGMTFFEGLQSAELSLIDHGKRDGVWADNGVYVSPYDYLEDSEKQALVVAYKTWFIERYEQEQPTSWLFQSYQPYLTNELFLHNDNEGKLTGEWYLVSDNWTFGYPNDMLAIQEVKNSYYTGNIILGVDDDYVNERASWCIHGTFTVNYELDRIKIENEDFQVYYGIFKIDESEPRARLRIQYSKDGYPTEFTDEVLEYVERWNYSRRHDAELLGVYSNP